MKQEELFLARVRNRADDRGLMAELRSLLNPNLRMRGWSAMATIGRLGDKPMETLAGLFAFYPQSYQEEKSFSFGVSCRILAEKRRKKGTADHESPLDVRFRRLLACEQREDVCRLLPEFVRGMKVEGIPVDYDTLYRDVRFWNDRVRERWAIDYWSSKEKEEQRVSD